MLKFVYSFTHTEMEICSTLFGAIVAEKYQGDTMQQVRQNSIPLLN